MNFETFVSRLRHWFRSDITELSNPPPLDDGLVSDSRDSSVSGDPDDRPAHLRLNPATGLPMVAHSNYDTHGYQYGFGPPGGVVIFNPATGLPMNSGVDSMGYGPGDGPDYDPGAHHAGFRGDY